MHVALEQAAGVGVGDHHRGDVRAELGREVGEVDAAVGGLGDLLDLIAGEGGGGRVGAVGRGRAPAPSCARRPGPRAPRGSPAGRRARRGRRPWATAPPPACRSASSASGPASSISASAPWTVETAAAAGGCRRSPAGAPSSRSGAGCASWCTSPADRGQVDGVVLLAEAHVVAQRLRLGEAGQADRARRASGRPGRAASSSGSRQVDAGLRPSRPARRSAARPAAGRGRR